MQVGFSVGFQQERRFSRSPIVFNCFQLIHWRRCAVVHALSGGGKVFDAWCEIGQAFYLFKRARFLKVYNHRHQHHQRSTVIIVIPTYNLKEGSWRHHQVPSGSSTEEPPGNSETILSSSRCNHHHQKCNHHHQKYKLMTFASSDVSYFWNPNLPLMTYTLNAPSERFISITK